MKPHYHPAFNARVYGPAEHRADIYWQKRKEKSPPLSDGDNSIGQLHAAAVLDHPAKPEKS